MNRYYLILFLRTVLTFVIILLLLFLLLEQASRFILFGFNSFNYFKMNSVAGIERLGLIKASPYLEKIYELKPNLNTYLKMTKFKINSQGLHDKEYSIKKPKNVFRIVVLGDSYVMAEGINIEDAFHTILEDRLNRESSDISYEFINFGVGGYDPRQYLATLKYSALAYNPNLVLFCFSLPFEPFNEEECFKRIYNVKPKTNPFFSSFLLKIMPKKNVVQRISRRLHEGMPERILKTENIFSELRDISEKQNIPICLVLLHSWFEYTEDIEKFKKLALKYNLFTIDTNAAFKNKRRSEYIIYKIDVHPNAKANKIFASVIYDYLIAQNLLPGINQSN